MPVVASLDIMLGAKTAPFEKGMDTAAKKTEGFASTVQGLASGGVGGLMGGMLGGGLVTGALAAGNALLSLGQSMLALPLAQMAVIDDQVKLADRLGITGEQFAGLRVAGELAGGGLEALTGPMEKMGILISSAAEGNEKAIETFSSLGLSFDELHSKDPVEALRAVVQEINKIDNEFDKNRAAKEIFGKSFASAKLAMKEIGENFEANMAMGQKLGLVLSPEQSKAVTDAKDATEIMAMAWEGVKNTITVELAPMIQELASVIVEMAVDLRKGIEEAAEIAKQVLPSMPDLNTDKKTDIAIKVFGRRFQIIGEHDEWGNQGTGGGGDFDTGLGGAKTLLSKASTELPKMAEQGSKEAFEIVAQAMMVNPVVAVAEKTNDKLDENNVLIDKMLNLWVDYLTGDGETGGGGGDI